MDIFRASKNSVSDPSLNFGYEENLYYVWAIGFNIKPAVNPIIIF